MKWKKILCLVTALALAVGTVTGCSKGKEGDSPENTTPIQAGADGAMGRYAETDIPLPDTEETAIGILWEDDTLTLYTVSDSEPASFSRFEYKDQSWSEPTEVPWLDNASSELHLDAAFLYLGENKKTYALAYPNDESTPYGQYILSTDDGSTAADLTPDTFQIPEGREYRDYILDITVLNDGTLGLTRSSSPAVEFYQNGKRIFQAEAISMSMDHQTMLASSGETIAVFSEDGKSVDFYHTEDFEKFNTISIGTDLTGTMIAPGGDGVWYLLNQKGILRLAEDGSIVETIMDGANGLMGASSADPRQFIAGPRQDFYCLYMEYSTHSGKLKYYSYNDSIPAAASDTLSIYSLWENPVISQAVYEFQSAHPELRVEYNSAVGEWESASSDDIRSLNAELLNGAGADVLILDGLPVQSYMEKGILLDISDLADSLSEKGVLLNIIGNAAQMDGKTYAYPAVIHVPIRFGTVEEVSALESLDALHAYIQTHPDNALLGKSAHSYVSASLFHTMYDELLSADGSPDEKKLAQFLEDLMKIFEISEIREFEEKYDLNMPWNSRYGSFMSGEFWGSGAFATIEELSGISSVIMPYVEMNEKNQTPLDIKGYYIPKALAGVNASSSSQELAKEFIETLFLESVQQTNTYTGFPVTGQTLNALADYVETDAAKQISVGGSRINPDTGEEEMTGGGYPDRARVEELITLIKGLDTPFLLDPVITETFLEEAERCYTGEQTPRQAASAICQKMRMYLAE